MPKRSGVLVAGGLVALGLSNPALAHKLRVFATAEGHQITGSAFFAGGTGAGGARVKVLDGGGRVLAELTPDGDGRFSYQAPAPLDLVVVAETGDGHRAEWRIPASDLTGAFPGQAGTSGQAAKVPISADQTSATMAASQGALALAPMPGAPEPALEPTLEAAIERAVARQMRPLREEIQAAQDQARLRDVLGGIGYIAGITGLALWWRSRRQGPRG